MTEKLMPCPFCGGAAVRKADPGVVNVPFGLVVDHVPGCFLAMPFPTDDGAVDLAWNTRHPTPAADEVEAVRAGNAVLKGEGTGLYSEAEDAIRQLIAAMQARSAEPRYKPNRGERPETLRDDGKCGMCGGKGRIEVTTYANAPDAGYAPCPMGCPRFAEPDANLAAAIAKTGERIADAVKDAPRIKASLRPAEPAGEEPVAWASPGQIIDFEPNQHEDGGTYIPLRKDRHGKFTMPLYAHPAAPLKGDA